jgi:carboxylesterase type B
VGVVIPFAFDTLDRVRSIWGRHPPQDLADAMHNAFVRFATDGDPGWPQYHLDERPTMEFGLRRRVVNDPRRAQRLLWA